MTAPTLELTMRGGKTYSIEVAEDFSIETSTSGRRGAPMLSTPIGSFLVSQIDRASLDGASLELPAVKVIEEESTEEDGQPEGRQPQVKPSGRRAIEAPAWRRRRKYAISNTRRRAG